MTLGYVFWHRPVRTDGYDRALLDFHRRLVEAPVDGLVRSRTVRVGDLPWLPGGGYEDWYLIDSFAALGALNAAAVDAAHRDAHDVVADASGQGAGAVYALIGGEDLPDPRQHSWFAKPAGWTYPQVRDAGRGAVWRRQLVLGPAPEFLAVDAPVPAALHPVSCPVTVLRP